MESHSEDVLVDAIDELAELNPSALLMLLVSGSNELRSAVDEGRADAELLVQLGDHIQMLIAAGPSTTQ